jgi:hypothetical protein
VFAHVSSPASNGVGDRQRKPGLRGDRGRLAVAQILKVELDEIVPGQLADPHLVERWQELLGRREVAERQRGDVHIASRPMVEAFVHVEMAANRRRLLQAFAVEPLAFRLQANHFDEHSSPASGGRHSHNGLRRARRRAPLCPAGAQCPPQR